MTFIKIAEANDIADGEARVVNANGTILALYRINGQFFATTNVCAHQGGPLGEGTLNGRIITCPWHGWKYDVETGVCTMFPKIQVKTYTVKLEGNDVMVEV